MAREFKARTGRRLAFGLPALLVALSGCGEGDRSGGSRQIIETYESETPAEYTVADQGCLQSGGRGGQAPLTLTSTVVRAWEGDQVVTRQVPLQGIVSAESLRTDLVSTTTWRDLYERECDLARPSGEECDDALGRERGWYRSASGGGLRVCQDGQDYGRDTYEGVGLTALHYLQQAHRRYTELTPGEAPLPRIALSVLPHFVDYYDNHFVNGRRARLKTYITHNMAYFPKPAMIAVFPEDARIAESAKGFFWESQFVLGHEHGHHVDFSRYAAYYDAMGLRWNAELHGFDDMHAMAEGGDPASDRARVHGAAAESFADLLAYYSEGATSASLVGLPCFGKNRDVTRDGFENGDDKVLTDDRLDVLLGRVRAERPPCGVPGYHDVHIVGAIFAHTIDGVVTRLAQTGAGIDPGGASDIGRRYQLVLKWKEEFMRAAQALPLRATGAEVLQPFATATEKVLAYALTGFTLRDDPSADQAAVERDVCELVKDRLPALTTAPFATSCRR